MAKIQYLLQSNKPNSPIYLRFSLGRKLDIKRKTGYVCDFSKWSLKNGLPKQSDATLKQLRTNLQKLNVFITEEYNKDYNNGIIINADWLVSKINKFNGRITIDEKQYLINYGEYYIEQIPSALTNKGLINSNSRTIEKYRTIVNKLIAFEKHSKQKFQLIDVDLNFSRNFIEYLINSGATNENTAGRYIKFVKTIVMNARKNGYNVNNQLDSIKGFTIPTIINPLSLDEINLISNHTFDENIYKITRDWFIIGCFVGQRASDLFRMNNEMIHKIENHKFIIITQEKTKKKVQIPIHPRVQEILEKNNNKFPPLFSKNIESNTALFNRYIKIVAKKAGIIEKVEGNLFNKETKKKDRGFYEKWQLISSHDCRRSFATNFYGKYSTPLLMNITGHSSERQFLDYIGLKTIDQSIELAEKWSTLE